MSQSVEIEHIKDLVPDPSNRRKHNPRNLGMVADALQHVGAARSIVIDEDNVILAGNGVTEAAAQVGITRLRVIEADGEELIAVRRRGLTADQKRHLALADNRAAELATWDTDQLAADLHDGVDLSPFFFEQELQKLNVMAPPAPPSVANQIVAGKFMVVVTCSDESAQVALLERFMAEGLECKALVS